MMMKPSLLIAFLLIISGISVSGLDILESSFFPPQFFVGDRVEHVVVVETEHAQRLRSPEHLPSSQWIEFYRIDVSPHPEGDRAEIRLVFSPFVPGTVSLPTVHLGPESLGGREILVRSVQTQHGSELQEARPQLLIPGTVVSIWVLSAVVLAVPLLYLLLSHYGAAWVVSLTRKLTEVLPYRRLRNRLRRLAKSMPSLSARAFYIELLSILRQYFTEKTRADCMSATTHEVSRIFARLSDEPAVVQDFQEVFRYGDLVKFAGIQAPDDIRRTHMEKVYRACAAIEQKEPDIPAQVMRYVHS